MSLQVRLIGIALGVLTILMVIYFVRRHKLLTIYSLTWFLLGFSLISFSLFKNLIFDLSELMGIHFPPLALLAIFCLALTVIVVHLSMIVSEQHKMIRKLEKDVALLNEIS